MGSSWDVFSGDEEECPNCGCKIKDTFLYECKDTLLGKIGSDIGEGIFLQDEVTHCGKLYCGECGTFLDNCPSCGSVGTIIGKIDPKSDDDARSDPPDDDSITPDDDDTPSYSSGSSPSYFPQSTTTKKSPDSGNSFVSVVFFALFLFVIFSLGKGSAPEKVTTPSASSVVGDSPLNTPGKADESDNENTTHAISVLPLNISSVPPLPPGVDGVVLDARHDYPIPGVLEHGALIFVGLDNQKSFSVTSYHDMNLERGDWVRIVTDDDGHVEVIKLADPSEALSRSPDAERESPIVATPPVFIPPSPPESQGVDGVVLDVEHNYSIPGRQELGVHLFVELSTGENVFITLFHDINLERRDKVRIARNDDGSLDVAKLPAE